MRFSNSIFVVPLIALIVLQPVYASSWPANIFNDASDAIKREVGSNADIIREAEKNLNPCTSRIDGGSCLKNQRWFVEDYVGAIYNDHTSLQNAAFLLDGYAEGAEYLVDGFKPIAINHIEACAWRLATLESGSFGVDDDDITTTQTNCGFLSDLERNVAISRKEVLLREIEAHEGQGQYPTAIIKEDVLD